MRWEFSNIMTFVERSPNIAFSLFSILHGDDVRPRIAARRIVEAMIQACNVLFQRVVQGSTPWMREEDDECAKLVSVSFLFQILYNVSGRSRRHVIEALQSVRPMDVVVNFLVEVHQPDFSTDDECAEYSCAVCDGAVTIGDDGENEGAGEEGDVTIDDDGAGGSGNGVPVFCGCRISRIVHRDCLYPKYGIARCIVCEEEVSTEREIPLFEDSRRLSEVSEIEFYVPLCESLDRALYLAARSTDGSRVSMDAPGWVWSRRLVSMDARR